MKKLIKKFQPVDLVLLVPAIIGLIYSLFN